MSAEAQRIHPAVFLTAGFFFIAYLQRVDVPTVYVLSAIAVALALALAARTLRRTLRRMRYILLALLILFGWQTPGVLLWPAMGSLSPSFDGLRLCVEQGVRLIGSVAVVATLLHRLDATRWLEGLSVVLHPLAYSGMDVTRFVVRLHLVLERLERGAPDWRQILHEREAPFVERELCLASGVGMRDRILLGLIVGLGTGVLVCAG